MKSMHISKRSRSSGGGYIIELVKRSIDLKAFIERESNVLFVPAGRNTWKGPCPLHNEKQPSFSVTHEDDGVWMYHCFGCTSGGTIIDYCLAIHGSDNPYGAAVFAAQKEGLKCDESIIAMATRDAKVQRDEQQETDLAHFVVSENCRKLLKMSKGDKETIAWVMGTFRAMNKLLDKDSTIASSFDGFRAEACQRISHMGQLK